MTVPLYGKKAAGRMALVDDADYELVMRHRWWLWDEVRKGGVLAGPYAITDLWLPGRQHSTIRMHKLLTGWSGTDHKDHDGLNNQRFNLRPAGERNELNLGNLRARTGCTSRYKGVSLLRGRWRAYIKGRHIGLFDSEEAAARAYDAAARAAFGEYAHLNFP